MFALREKYKNEIIPQLKSELNISNLMLLPKLEKIVISVGAGDYAKDSKVMQNIADTISLIAGQKAVITIAKKSVAGFKMREGMPMGVKVTLRGKMMYNFLEKLIVIALPRVKDFRGVKRNGFDGRGNYSFGLNEQLMFPEVVYDDIMVTHGMNITFVTSTQSDKEAFKLLELLGMPCERTIKWRKNQLLQRQKERQSLAREPIRDVKCVGDRILFIEILVCVGYAYAKWVMRV